MLAGKLIQSIHENTDVENVRAFACNHHLSRCSLLILLLQGPWTLGQRIQHLLLVTASRNGFKGMSAAAKLAVQLLKVRRGLDGGQEEWGSLVLDYSTKTKPKSCCIVGVMIWLQHRFDELR